VKNRLTFVVALLVLVALAFQFEVSNLTGVVDDRGDTLPSYVVRDSDDNHSAVFPKIVVQNT